MQNTIRSAREAATTKKTIEGDAMIWQMRFWLRRAEWRRAEAVDAYARLCVFGTEVSS